MSKILSYNKKTSGEDWIPLSSQYNADEIEMIADPNAGLSQQPRTAIPSPFAQMDLVKNRREGKTIFYALADAHIVTILSQGLDHIEEE